LNAIEAAMTFPANHPPVKTPRIGVLLVNLGTPDAPTTEAVRRYLKQFLSDPRVVEIPQLIWQPILRGVILNTRPQKSAAAYARVWTDKGSPLAFHTIAQAEALAKRIGDAAIVRHAMRYGQPSIETMLGEMKEAGCSRILIAPLYPQYSGATTGTVQDEVFRVLSTMRWQPALRTLPAYHDDPAYIEALRASVAEGLAALNFEPDAIVASFHGMPERTLHLGDPYHCQCQKTARLLSEALGWSLPPKTHLPGWPAKENAGLPSSLPDFPPIVSKRSKNWRWRARSNLRKQAASISPTLPA
jgi:protoporphyrin/coproporphyrin ferrochelatase